MSQLQPKLVTESELVTTLLPYIQGYAWALDTIGDLWRMGAPVPQPGPNGETMRILLPGQFKAWWGDVCERMGYQTGVEEMLGEFANR